MKRAIIFILSIVIISLVCKAGDIYRPSLGFGCNWGFGNCYQDALRYDGKAGISVYTEQSINLIPTNGCHRYHSYNQSQFLVGLGVGIDMTWRYFDCEYNRYRESTSMPLYLTMSYLHNRDRVSPYFKANIGYYRWFDKEVMHPDNVMAGIEIGVSFPIICDNNIVLSGGYTYIGNNRSKHGPNCPHREIVNRNHKLYINVSLLF